MGLLDSYPDKYLPRSTGALVTIDYVEKQIHAGFGWIATHKEKSIGVTVISVLITTPASSIYGMSVSVEADLAIEWEFGEAPLASGGTTITGRCTDRTADTADPLTITYAPTYTSSGTILHQHTSGSVGGGGPFGAGEGGAVTSDEIEMKVSTDYIVHVPVLPSNTTAIIELHYHIEA